MTSFETQYVMSALSPMVSKNQGDFSNRVKNSNELGVNNLKTLGSDVVVLGTGAGTLVAAKKCPKFAKRLLGVADDLITKLPAKFAIKLWKAPGMAKIAGLVALPVVATLQYIASRHFYNAGQINQKYTDKAKIEKHTKEII